MSDWATGIGLSATVYHFLVVGGWDLAAPAEPLRLGAVDVDSELFPSVSYVRPSPA